MNYTNGVKYMQSLANSNGSFSPYKDITITYPGYKKAGDYRVTIQNTHVPTHSDICKALYDLILKNNYTYTTLCDFLNDVYTNGTDTEYTDSTLEKLQNIIYWITLQEEINYPRNNNFAGINLPFCRFYEAIYSTQPQSNLLISTVQSRCNNYGRSKPKLFTISNAPSFYHY